MEIFANSQWAIRPKTGDETQKDLASLADYISKKHNKMTKKTFFIHARIVFEGTVKDGGEDDVVNWGFLMHGEVELVTDSEE